MQLESRLEGRFQEIRLRAESADRYRPRFFTRHPRL